MGAQHRHKPREGVGGQRRRGEPAVHAAQQVVQARVNGVLPGAGAGEFSARGSGADGERAAFEPVFLGGEPVLVPDGPTAAGAEGGRRGGRGRTWSITPSTATRPGTAPARTWRFVGGWERLGKSSDTV